MANELRTYGDLKKAIQLITLKQKVKNIAGGAGDVAIEAVIDAAKTFIPGIGTAKTTFDFIKAAISKPDTKKTKTWLDKLDIDDDMSKIIDNTVENGFMQMISKTIEGESDSKPLEQDFNMNQKLVNYLKQNYKGRTVTGIQENKMKEKLRQLIREEIKKTIIEVEAPKQDTTVQGSFRADIFKKLMGSSFDPAKFNSAMTKLKNNQSRSATDNAFLGDVVRALMYTDDNAMLNNIFNYLKTLKTKPKT